MAGVLDEHVNGRQFFGGEGVTVADFVLAYALNWANEAHYSTASRSCRSIWRSYTRSHAPPRIAEALASINS
jgi:glutathione S-transferase